MDRHTDAPVQPRPSSPNTAALWILAAIATIFFLRYAKVAADPDS